MMPSQQGTGQMQWSEACPLAEADFPLALGPYKLFLARGGSLAGTPLGDVPQGALLYIGKAEEGLRKRHDEQHLAEESGWSSFRRSVGAVLREELHFVAVPRRRAPHRSNYSFRPDDESQITQWMLQTLSVSWTTSVPAADLKAEEKRLTRALRPVLNITHNPAGEYVPALRRLRAACCEEMRRQL